jgi:serine/threonine-protein kinase
VGRRSLWPYAVAGLVALTALLLADDLRLRYTAGGADTAAAEAPFSFIISPPEHGSFAPAPLLPSPALSPDGRSLAFVAAVASKPMLWIQQLGQLEARVIPGTEGADRPFWSADGRFIVFLAEGRLKRVAIADGAAAQNLVALSPQAFHGGAAGPDGTIVFAGADGLYGLNADGEAVSLTKLDTSRGEFSHRSPAFLPDSDRFVYLVLSTDLEHQGIFLGALADPSLKVRLVGSGANAAAGIDEHGQTNLFFLNEDSSLVAQPFDAALERLTGEPVVVAPQAIEPAPSVRAAAFTVSRRVLAYRPRFAPPSRLVWVDRRGARSDVAATVGQSYRFPALSGDGTTLVAMRADEADTAGLWLLELGRAASPERLARGGVLMSAWTKDGRAVVYSSPQPQGWHLVWQPIAGRADARTLVAGAEPVVKRIRDVTDDLVLFQGSDSDLWLLPLADGGSAYPLMRTPGLENHARVSPNGRWIAFSATDANETRVYVTTFPEPTDVRPVSEGAGSDPQWRSDGRELYYIGPGDLLMAVEVETDGTIATNSALPLFDARFDPQTRAFGSAYAASPDGERFLVAELGADSEIELIVTRNWAREGTSRLPTEGQLLSN